MGKKSDVWQGTLALMVLKTLETLGPMHGYGVARRIEQTSGDRLLLNYGTLYPALLKLEQEGYIASRVGRLGQQSQGEVLRLTRAGHARLKQEAREWEETAGIIARFLTPREGGRMRKLRAALVRLGGWWGREGRERELREELEAHFQMHMEDNLRAGMSPAQARREAALRFGSVESAKEGSAQRVDREFLEKTRQDLVYAVRGLRRNPAFALTAILSLALGIGASVSIFTVADNLLAPAVALPRSRPPGDGVGDQSHARQKRVQRGLTRPTTATGRRRTTRSKAWQPSARDAACWMTGSAWRKWACST